MSLLDDKTNQPSEFRTRNWAEEINDESRRNYNVTNKIKFKTSMIRSNLCNYSDAKMQVKVTITVANTGIAAVSNNRNKKVIFKNYVPFTNCICEINNTQVDDAHKFIRI